MVNKYLAHVYVTRDSVVYDYVGNRYVLADNFTIANQAVKDTLLSEHPQAYADDPKYDHCIELQEVTS